MEERVFFAYTQAIERERAAFFVLALVVAGATFVVLWFVVYLLALLLLGGWPNWLQAVVAAAVTAGQWPLFMKLPPPALPDQGDWLLRWKVARREPPVWQALAWAWQLRRSHLLQERLQRLLQGQETVQAMLKRVWYSAEPIEPTVFMQSEAEKELVDDLLPFKPLLYHEGNPCDGFKFLGEFKAELQQGLQGNG